MKTYKIGTILIISILLISEYITAGSKNNWYEKSRYGLFVHYVPGLSVYPKGGTTSDINTVANSFDAKQLAADAQTFGVEYVVFTVMHLRMRPLYPSAVTEKWRPGNSSSRDCIRDLINELKPKGIRLMLYVHTTDGYDFTAADQLATGYNVDSIHHYPIWNNYVNELMTEIGARYGTDIDGMWQDMCMSSQYKNMIDKPRLRASMLTGDPNRILVGNGSTMVDGMDYSSKEYYPSGPMTTWRTFGYQIATLAGGSWWAAIAQGQKAARLTPQQMYRFTVLQSAVTNDGGTAWAVGVYIGGGWEDGVKNMFTGCGNYIKQVETAIKGTVPSTSYITAVGKTLATINNGIVATKSPDDKYEYIHVVYPPAGNTLTLPAPADYKKFGEAIYMNNGTSPVTISQTASNVVLTLLPTEKFDSVNSVIRLQVIDYPGRNANY
jgi:alpha-L-fucosidase